MSKISEMIRDSGKTSLFFSLLLFLPILLVSLLISPPDVFFKIWPWATSFFSLGHSFFGGFAVSVISMLFMLWTFYFIKNLLSMLKADYVAIKGNRILTISASLFCIFFMIWISSFFGMLHATFPLGEDLYMFRHIGLLTAFIPIPLFLHTLFSKFNNDASENNKSPESTVIIITALATIAIFFVITSIDDYFFIF